MKTFKTIALLLFILTAAVARAALTLPPIFSDGMIVQQQKPIPVWGKADPNATVTLTLADNEVTVTADSDGNWKAALPSMSHGGPYTLTIVANSDQVEISDVLVGEVWLASGQSNMAWTLRRSTDSDLDIALSNNPDIRFSRGRGEWVKASPATSGSFSGAAYHFATTLHQALGVPVGIIERARGSSTAEAWLPIDALRADGRFEAMLDHWQKLEEAGWDQEEVDRQYQQKLDEWQARVDAETAGRERKPTKPLNPLTGPKRPAILFDSVLAPVVGYGIRGFIWYQGEANATRAKEYTYLFPLLITTWRDLWQDPDLPFYWAQLPNYMSRSLVGNSKWAELREAQTKTLELPATGQAVIIDVGSTHTIHPANKRDVGRRLARLALADCYDVPVAARSPLYAEHDIKGKSIVIRFDTMGSELVIGPQPGIPGFAIAGDDRVFFPATARITGPDTVEVTSRQVPAPVAVRYAWTDNPEINLYSDRDLPVTPFRTDDWDEIIVGEESQ